MRIGLVGLGRIGAFHAETLVGLPDIEALVISDARAGVAEEVAATLRGQRPEEVVEVADPEALLDAGLDGLVVATATQGHAEWIRRGIAAGTPTFCEKPVAADLTETIALAELAAASATPVHIGHQRRFDTGFRRARAAVDSGTLGFVHTIRANTHDQSPPPAEFIPTSGGIFRDCGVHDFDAIRFVTGREIVSAYAVGANKGADFFSAAGDVDSGAAVLTLDDDTLVLMSTTRYNGGGHDVRMEVMGERGTITAGLDHSLAMDSAEEGVDFPRGPRSWSFMDRFGPAYRAELTAFLDVAAGRAASPCTITDALEAFRTAEACELSRAERRPVLLSEIEGL